MINSALKDIIEAINAKNNGTEAYDTQAEVVRIEGRTAWVHIPGGVDETPVELTIAAKRGDTVQVRVANGQAWLTGNGSAPPTDDTTANTAKSTADRADKKAKSASETAEEAKEAVDGVVQHFWHDANGAHIKGDDGGYQNNLTSNGMALVDLSSGNPLAEFLINAVKFYTDAYGETASIEFHDPETQAGEQIAKISYFRNDFTNLLFDAAQYWFNSDAINIGNDTLQNYINSLIDAKLGSESFNGTRNTTNTSQGVCTGVYDRASGTVRITLSFTATSSVGTSAELFTIPSAYRPSANKTGAGYGKTSSSTGGMSYRVDSNGVITQRTMGACTGGFGIIEYEL